MGWLIGTDEAGYGPNLGPLVIACTVWRVPDPWLERDLYELFSGSVQRSPGCATPTSEQLVVADSKQLYQARGSLRGLEIPVLAALDLLEWYAATTHSLFARLAPDDYSHWRGDPWNEQFDREFPQCSSWQEARAAASRFVLVARQQGVTLAAIRTRVVSPTAWNQACQQHGNKAQALSTLTLQLVRWALRFCAGQEPSERCRVRCDKHGGRNRYQHLLQTHVDDALFWIMHESRERSRYRWGDGHEITFCSGGESDLPTAWASLVAKYLREQAMQAWNTYWQRQVPELLPTAGYPGDARRFFDQIQHLLEPLEIPLHRVWRDR